MDFKSWLDKTIEYGFFVLFFFTPLIFTPVNFELFEFNKMLFVYLLTLIIITSWIAKMILKKSFIFKSSPFDIFLLLFLFSQTISTIFSIDKYTSIWGYYSRSHGGLFSSLAYALLFWAYLSNVKNKNIKLKFLKIPKAIFFILTSGILVAAYGFLERFGIDKNMWVQDVQNRVFSTLGQPNWLAAYLNAIIFIPLAFFIKSKAKNNKIAFGLIYLLFYIVLVFTKSKSGIAAFWIALLVFYFSAFLIKGKKILITGLINLSLFALLALVFYPSLGGKISKSLPFLQKTEQSATKVKALPSGNEIRIGGTPSNQIRAVVWKGALNIWQNYPIFGSGNETFAYSYYNHRPQKHNNNSEWDFLYNKAHNEYLNYLALTGIIGLLTMFSWQLAWPIWLFFKHKRKLFIGLIGLSVASALLILNPANVFSSVINRIFIYPPILKPLSLALIASAILILVYFSFLEKYSKAFKFLPWQTANKKISLLNLSLLTGFVSIMLTNFYGFSVVIIGLYTFLFPSLSYSLSTGKNNNKDGRHELNKQAKLTTETNLKQQFGLIILTLFFLFFALKIINVWTADKLYAQGKGLSDQGQYLAAFEPLVQAEEKNPHAPVLKAQLGETSAALAHYYSLQEGSQSAKMTKDLTDLSLNKGAQALEISPFHIGFYKSMAKIYLSLSYIDPSYQNKAIESLQVASQLSPTDPKILLNIAILQQQTKQKDKAILSFQKAIQLKPNYDRAYVYLARLHKENKDLKKAVETYQALLDNFYPPNKEALEFLQKQENK